MLENQKKRISRSDYLTNKIMAVLILTFVMSLALMMINKGLGNIDMFYTAYYAMYVLAFAGLAGVILGIVKEITDRKKGTDRSRAIITGHGIAVCSAVISISFLSLLFGDYYSSIKVLYVAIPALAILYLIYVIYQREFFALTALGALIALYFWRFGQFYKGSMRFLLAQIVILLVCLIISALLYLLKRGDGAIKLKKRTIRLLAPDAEYAASFVCIIAFIALVVTAFFIPNAFMLYAAFATLAFIFVMAVYFAVKMM